VGVALDGLMHAPPPLDFSINEFVLMLGFYEFSADVNYLLDRSDTLVLDLYINEFINVGNPQQFMSWCGKRVNIEVNIKDKGCWQVANAKKIHFEDFEQTSEYRTKH
jgi:hypothetical protein